MVKAPTSIHLWRLSAYFQDFEYEPQMLATGELAQVVYTMISQDRTTCSQNTVTDTEGQSEPEAILP